MKINGKLFQERSGTIENSFGSLYFLNQTSSTCRKSHTTNIALSLPLNSKGSKGLELDYIELLSITGTLLVNLLLSLRLIFTMLMI